MVNVMLDEDGPFHAGEIAVQERTGERALARRHGAMIRDRLPDGARAFVERQGVVAVGAAAPDGQLWASLWCGDPGFLHVDPLGACVQLQWPMTHIVVEDPVRRVVRAGEPLSMVVVDFERRGRLRINGIVRRVDASTLELLVVETFGNCTKYIQRRRRVAALPDGDPTRVEQGRTLDANRCAFVARTDTLFVASIHPERGLDVSHRGGTPGFARVVDDRTLRIPDYPGNSLFQTLGNFEADSRAAIACIDFEGRRVLSLTGSAAMVFAGEDPAHPSGGTGRYWSFTVDRWVEHPLPSSIRWALIERSSFNP